MFENKELPLGCNVAVPTQYDKDQLVAIPRKLGRRELGIKSPLPFHGYDLWTAYEISWLDRNGKPCVALADIVVNCDSEFLVESKSLKLYFNSLNNTKFDSIKEVERCIAKDLNNLLKTKIVLTLSELNSNITTVKPPGECIDNADVVITKYDHVDANVLQCAESEAENGEVTETLYSDLFKTNCPITNQPDWATVVVTYQGLPINRASLLEYLISYRNHTGFHENCVEQIFMDIMEKCALRQLTVYARYTRRGGIDINPIRSTQTISIPTNIRLIRQ